MVKSYDPGEMGFSAGRTLPHEQAYDSPFMVDLKAKLQIISKEPLSVEEARNFADRIFAGERGMHLPQLVYDFGEEDE